MSDLPQLQPFDEHNQTLQSHVHPTDWTNPTPAGRYNLVVIGAGTAGLVTAAGAAGLGAKVALIERDLMGGDCLNVGCVPSKAMISSARVAATVRNSKPFGIEAGADVEVDFPAVMERMRKLRAGMSPHDSAARFQHLGIDVFLGEGRFTGHHSIDVAGTELTFKKAVIATGARSAKLPIPGLDDVSPLTNETVFSLTELPQRIVIIGGGPIGTEMAQTFARLGSTVTQIEKESRILSKDDAEAALIVQRSLQSDGVNILLNAETIRCELRGEEKVVVVRQDGQEKEVIGDQILVGIGRAPNVNGMGLETANIEYDERNGVAVDDQLRTTNKNIFAAGDVCSQYKFTHAADFMARLVIRNALFFGRSKVSDLIIPWTTYTSPELAHIGMTAREASERTSEIETFTQELSEVDRAILESETAGFVRVHVKKGSDKILGGTIVAANAGDMIGELSLAMTNGLGLKKIGNAIHPYPTQAEAIRKLGDQYNRKRLTPFVKSLFNKWLTWTR